MVDHADNDADLLDFADLIGPGGKGLSRGINGNAIDEDDSTDDEDEQWGDRAGGGSSDQSEQSSDLDPSGGDESGESGHESEADDDEEVRSHRRSTNWNSDDSLSLSRKTVPGAVQMYRKGWTAGRKTVVLGTASPRPLAPTPLRYLLPLRLRASTSRHTYVQRSWRRRLWGTSKRRKRGRSLNGRLKVF
jgi:hypothetical protein